MMRLRIISDKKNNIGIRLEVIYVNSRLIKATVLHKAKSDLLQMRSTSKLVRTFHQEPCAGGSEDHCNVAAYLTEKYGHIRNVRLNILRVSDIGVKSKTKRNKAIVTNKLIFKQ